MAKIMMDYLLPDAATSDLKLPVNARFRGVMHFKGSDKITLLVEQEQIPTECYTQTFYVSKSNTRVPNAAYYVGSCYVKRPTHVVVRHLFAKKTPAQLEDDRHLVKSMDRVNNFFQEITAEREARAKKTGVLTIGRLRRLFRRGNTDA